MKFSLLVTALFLNAFSTNTETLSYRLGSTWINIERLRFPGQESLIITHVHDNEETAKAVAREVLSERGGLLLSINNNKERNVSFTYGGVQYKFDPNRIYSPAGREATLKAQSSYNRNAAIKLQRFASYFLGKIPKAKTIISVHNNTNESFSILSYARGGDYEKDALQVFHNPGHDIDDFFLTTSFSLYNKLKDLGYNVVLQHNKRAADDGSMSVYYGRKNRSYVNVEAEHGHYEQQKAMLNALADLLR